jgi:hypothetical protein
MSTREDSDPALDVDGAATCSFCGRHRPGVQVVTVTDTSGGGHALMCPRCRALIKRPRCALCGRPKQPASRAEAVHLDEDGEPAGSGPICDGCRERALAGGGGA